jgi:hypothetical protein
MTGAPKFQPGISGNPGGRLKSNAPRPAATNTAPDKNPISEEETGERRDFVERERTRPRAPRVQVKSAHGKPLDIGYASAIEGIRLMSAFATANPGFANLMLAGILNAACEGGPENPPSEQDINRALAAVTGIGARDETEAMLATQMVATHVAAVTLLRRLKGAENIPQQDSAGSLAVKLLRTYAMQMEALQRYRGKGRQKVTVEHVHVHPGGQAIVGAVTPGSGGSEKSEERAHAPGGITYEPGTPMRSPDTQREPVPIACGPGQAPL